MWMGGVVRAQIQTVEDMYRLIRTAVTGRQPLSALYDGLPRSVCPHRLGRNNSGQARVLCYQYGGDSSSGLEPSGSGQLAMHEVGEVQPDRTAGRRLAHSTEPLPPADLHHRCRCGRRRLSGRQSTKRAVRKASCQAARDRGPQRGNRARIMPLGSDASLGAGTPAAARGLIVRDCRRGLRGKNGSARPQGTHTPQRTEWRDGENRASLSLRNDRVRVPA